MKLLPFNEDAIKLGLCGFAPHSYKHSCLGLSNNCAIADSLFSSLLTRCNRLYRRKAHVHHYTEYMEQYYFDESLEKGNVDLFLEKKVRVVEASAFMKLTLNIVRYRVAGLEKCPSTGKTICRNKVIFKVSRTELATLAMHPPPADMVAKLLAKGLVTAEQAALAPGVTMCDDVAVESDSGGHTDNRHMPVLLPVILPARPHCQGDGHAHRVARAAASAARRRRRRRLPWVPTSS